MFSFNYQPLPVAPDLQPSSVAKLPAHLDGWNHAMTRDYVGTEKSRQEGTEKNDSTLYFLEDNVPLFFLLPC